MAALSPALWASLRGGWQPTIDGEPVPHDAGAKGPEFDLSQPNVVGRGVYTNVGAIGRRAKIFSYDAAESAGGLGIVENGMPSMAPGEYPFYGWLDMAFSEDNDGTYRVGVKYNNYMKVIKFNAADHTVISEFRINTLGMQDYKRQMLSIHCDSVCLPEHGCDTKVWGTGLVTDLWGLVAHNDSAAVVIRVLDRAWFQLYADNTPRTGGPSTSTTIPPTCGPSGWATPGPAPTPTPDGWSR